MAEAPQLPVSQLSPWQHLVRAGLMLEKLGRHSGPWGPPMPGFHGCSMSLVFSHHGADAQASPDNSGVTSCRPHFSLLLPLLWGLPCCITMVT